MKYLLDTDMVSLFQHGHPVVCSAVAKHAPRDVAITVMTVEEQLSGWYTELRRAKKPETLAGVYLRMAKTVMFYSAMLIVPLTEAAIHRFEDLKAMKIKIGKTDLCIAAIALQENAVVVTRNVRDFKKVPGLLIEDWSN